MKIGNVIVIVLLALVLAGCGILSKNKGVVGKASVAESKAKARIEIVDDAAARADAKRLGEIGTFALGVNYLLTKDLGQSREIVVAKALNERVVGLANKPDFKEAQEIVSIADQMVASQANGQEILAKKDKEVEELGLTVRNLQQAKEQAVKSYVKVADKNAALTDQYKASLGQMDRLFGLGAVWYGAKRFVISWALILGIGSIVFLALRILSTSNPIAASVFSIFNQAGSWFVYGIAALFPKALSLAGNTATTIFGAHKRAMSKIVDAIQITRERAMASGKPATIEDYLTEAEKTMNDDEKAIVQEIKKALNWRQV